MFILQILEAFRCGAFYIPSHVRIFLCVIAHLLHKASRRFVRPHGRFIYVQ